MPVNGETETQRHKQPECMSETKKEEGARWRWEASLIPLCISFTSLAVSTNRIGSKAQGLGGE